MTLRLQSSLQAEHVQRRNPQQLDIQHMESTYAGVEVVTHARDEAAANLATDLIQQGSGQ